MVTYDLAIFISKPFKRNWVSVTQKKKFKPSSHNISVEIQNDKMIFTNCLVGEREA
jgi:hypothetical protein